MVSRRFVEEICMSDLIAKEYTCFEDIKQTRPDGSEYWSARALSTVLDYNKWENFHKVIQRAIIACENSGHIVSECFPDVRKTSPMPKDLLSFVKREKQNSEEVKGRTYSSRFASQIMKRRPTSAMHQGQTCSKDSK